MILVTAGEMQEMDRQTISTHGIPGLELMESAGRGATRVLLDQFGDQVKAGVALFAAKATMAVMALLLPDAWRKKASMLASICSPKLLP